VIAENLIRGENTAVTPIGEIIHVLSMSPVFIALFTLVASTFQTRAALQAEVAATAPDRCASAQRRDACASSNLTGSSGFCGPGCGRTGGVDVAFSLTGKDRPQDLSFSRLNPARR
jgi:hypothetical protein